MTNNWRHLCVVGRVLYWWKTDFLKYFHISKATCQNIDTLYAKKLDEQHHGILAE